MKFFLIISVFLFINFVLLLLPKLMPNYIKPSQTIFWIIWTNSLFIFSMVLPHQTSYIFPNAKSVMNIANIFKKATSGEEEKKVGPSAPPAPPAKLATEDKERQKMGKRVEERKKPKNGDKKASAKKAKKESKKPVVVVESNTSSKIDTPNKYTKNNSPSIVVVKENEGPQ